MYLSLAAPAALAEQTLRIATFNIAMGFAQAGEMTAVLESGEHARLLKVAEILQRVRPDIVLLNEFDFDPGTDAAGLLNRNYLSTGLGGQAPIEYGWHFRAPVNTGVDSGLDLDGDGRTGGPGDAWGFGHYQGQYGMLLLSRYPVQEENSRTFQHLRWSRLPGASRPAYPDGTAFYPDETWERLRLSSKSHWDVAIDVGGTDIRLLAHHPTPPVFDGPENRNGLRNYDEIRFWKIYYRAWDPDDPRYKYRIIDDQGRPGGLAAEARFVIAGDFNADPFDGDSLPGAITQLLRQDWIDSRCEPSSPGGLEASLRQGGINDMHRGHPALDTSDFNDERTGNLRLDYVLPSKGLRVTGCGVYWPAEGEPGHELIDASDHRLVWVDVAL